MQTNQGTHVESRKEDLNLQNYITKSKKRLQAILKRLQWSEELVLKNCSDKSNVAATLSDDEAEPPLPVSFSTNNSVVIAEDALRAIVADPKAEIPQRFSDLQCNFNRQQKLQIYEHVVQNTEKLLEPELTVPINDESHSSMTFAEIVAIKKREKKQKRRKYRTSKPTHIEEVRNLVELQMQALEQYLHPEKVTAPRLSNRERDLLQHQNKYRGRSTSKDKEWKSATNDEVSDKSKKERRKVSASRRRNASRERSTSVNKNYQKLEKEHLKRESRSGYQDHRKQSSSHKHSASRDREHGNSLKQRTHRSGSRDRRHRTPSKERRHRSRTRSKDSRRHQKCRSRSKEKNHRSRSKDKIHRSRLKERRHRSRSRSRSKHRRRSRDRRDNTRISRSRSHEKKRQKEHYYKRSDYEAKGGNYVKDRHKDSRCLEKSKYDEHRTNGNSKIYVKSLTEEEHRTKEKAHSRRDHLSRERDVGSDSYRRDETYTSSTQNINESLDPIIKRRSSNEEIMDKTNNGLISHYIKLEVKTDPDDKTTVFEELKMKEESH